MDRLSACVEVLRSRWLASSINCCFPRLPAQSEQDLSALEKHREICYQQPVLVAPPNFNIESQRSESQCSHRPAQWLAEGRNLASRASSRASLTTRRAITRRPNIGAPSDFRRFERPSGRITGFRPLELSIYLPGNELPSLPVFLEDDEDDQGLEFPPQALTKARSDSMLSRPSTSFTIPRKPVASTRTLSMDASRSSMDSRYTGDVNFALGTRSILRRPSITTTQSTQDFLNTLDARLPRSPPRLRSKSGPEPIYTLYRRASEQSLRLRTHLEERAEIERQLPECDTILEEKQADLPRKFSSLSPISSHGDAADDLHDSQPHSDPHQASQFTNPSLAPPPSQASLHELLEANPPQTSNSISTRARISQWLLRSTSAHSSPRPSETLADHDTFPRRPSTAQNRTSTASSLSTTSNTAELATPWTTPRSSPKRKGSSFSSCQAGPVERRLYYGEEKSGAGASMVADVGVAY
ncbi:hypothetical protein MMC22_004133 [Lobaria immixta]|nr:hypothetical protein [Lobaria immixta]